MSDPKTKSDGSDSSEIDFGEFETLKFEIAEKELPEEVWSAYGVPPYLPPTMTCP